MKRLTCAYLICRGHPLVSKWLKDGRQPPQAALEKIINHFRRVDRPTYLGNVSVEIGYSLNQTVEMFDVLASSGKIRPLSDDEKVEHEFHPMCDVWVLVRPGNDS